VEADALYRRVGYRWGEIDITGATHFERDRANSWEFPMMLRKTLGHGIYVGVGYAPRTIRGSGHVTATTAVSINPPAYTYHEFDTRATWETTHGAVVSAGMEKRLGRIRLAPEVRYVYWNRPSVEIYGSRGFSIVSTQHQVGLLIGFTIP
jgi:hypothetical protein